MKDRQALAVGISVALAVFACNSSLGVAAAEGEPTSPKARESVSKLRNSDVRWTQSEFGAVAGVDSPRIEWLIKTHERIDHLLVCALEDPQRYQAAHVVLSRRHAVDSATETLGTWSRIRVGFDAIPPQLSTAELKELQAEWAQALSANGLTCQ